MIPPLWGVLAMPAMPGAASVEEARPQGGGGEAHGWESALSSAATPGSPAPCGADLAADVLGALRAVPAPWRGPECAVRRGRIRVGLAFIDKVLDETEEALKFRPRKTDKLTAGTYHACFRHLHWVMGRCQQMQDLAETLENYDSSRLHDQAVSADYALLSVDIVTRYDRSQQLLQALGAADEDEEQGQRQAAPQPCGHLSQWLLGAVAVCSSRSCVRDTPCAGGAEVRKAAAQC